jgi:ribosome modulation factor
LKVEYGGFMKKLTGVWVAAAVASVCLMSTSNQPAQAAALPSGLAMGMGQYGPPPGPPPGEPWNMPPGEYNEISRRGFHDGVEGARKDYGNHRRPDVNNREEYRHPDMPRPDRGPYRRAFERGYRVGVEHIYNGQRF